MPLSYLRGNTREVKIETCSGRGQLQADVTSWFVRYCTCSRSPPCRPGPVGDVKLVRTGLWSVWRCGEKMNIWLSFQSGFLRLATRILQIIGIHSPFLGTESSFWITHRNKRGWYAYTTFTSWQNAAYSNKVVLICWVDYALEGSAFILSKCDFSRMFHTERPWHTYRFTAVIVSGRQDLPSDASAFSLTSFEA